MSPLAITFVCIGGLLIVLFILYFYYNNKEIALRKESEAQRGKVKAVRDQMFKVLQEQANVATDYREAFGKIFPEIIGGRYVHDKDNLMKWIQEANPNFDTSLYHKVMNAIEVQRDLFTTTQDRMLDIINQRATLIEQYPQRWFVKNKDKIEYVVIASTSTNDTIDTGIDDFTVTFKQ